MEDQDRPLNVPPEQWKNIIATQRRGAIENDVDIEAIDGLSLIDYSIDGLIENIQQCYKGIKKLNLNELSIEEKNVVSKIEDLLDTAVAPYVADMAEIMDTVEEE